MHPSTLERQLNFLLGSFLQEEGYPSTSTLFNHVLILSLLVPHDPRYKNFEIEPISLIHLDEYGLLKEPNNNLLIKSIEDPSKLTALEWVQAGYVVWGGRTPVRGGSLL